MCRNLNFCAGLAIFVQIWELHKNKVEQLLDMKLNQGFSPTTKVTSLLGKVEIINPGADTPTSSKARCKQFPIRFSGDCTATAKPLTVKPLTLYRAGIGIVANTSDFQPASLKTLFNWVAYKAH